MSLLAVAALTIGAEAAFAQSKCESKCKSKCESMDAIEAIMTRSSVRSYSSQPVEDEKIETLMRAAMAAPTGMNRQPWAFYVVQSREKLEELGSKIHGSRMAATAQLAIIVCGDLNKAGDGDSWRHDTAAAGQNILIAANAMGLGAVWTGAYPSEERVNTLREVLSIPDNLVPICCIPVGYPDSEPTIKEKWNTENIIYVK